MMPPFRPGECRDGKYSTRTVKLQRNRLTEVSGRAQLAEETGRVQNWQSAQFKAVVAWEFRISSEHVDVSSEVRLPGSSAQLELQFHPASRMQGYLRVQLGDVAVGDAETKSLGYRRGDQNTFR